MSNSPEREAIKKLFAFSKNVCAFPECNNTIVDYEYKTVIGEICHIKGRSPGSARYDPEQPDNERNAFENLILLCPKHHKIIDSNPEKFTVEVLQRMKEEHESMAGIKEIADTWVVDELVGKF